MNPTPQIENEMARPTSRIFLSITTQWCSSKAKGTEVVKPCIQEDLQQLAEGYQRCWQIIQCKCVAMYWQPLAVRKSQAQFTASGVVISFGMGK